MTQKIKQAAEKYATVFTVGGGIPVINEEILNAVEFGANFMLEELGKGGEKFATKQMFSFPSDEPIMMIDIAALQSANAKIAKLTEAFEKLLREYYDEKGKINDDIIYSKNAYVQGRYDTLCKYKSIIEVALKSCSQYDEQTEEGV